MLSMTCPECLRTFKYPESRAGTSANCPACKKAISLDALPVAEAKPSVDVSEYSTSINWKKVWIVVLSVVGAFAIVISGIVFVLILFGGEPNRNLTMEEEIEAFAIDCIHQASPWEKISVKRIETRKSDVVSEAENIEEYYSTGYIVEENRRHTFSVTIKYDQEKFKMSCRWVFFDGEIYNVRQFE